MFAPDLSLWLVKGRWAALVVRDTLSELGRLWRGHEVTRS
jgi:hypothetical protein